MLSLSFFLLTSMSDSFPHPDGSTEKFAGETTGIHQARYAERGRVATDAPADGNAGELKK